MSTFAGIPAFFSGDNGTEPNPYRKTQEVCMYVSTKAAAESASISANIEMLVTLGFSKIGLGGARYVRVHCDTLPAGKRLHQIVTSNGDVFRVIDADVNSGSFGALGDFETDDTIALQSLIDYCASQHLPALILAGRYRHTGLQLSSNIQVKGSGRSSCILTNVGTRDSISIVRPGKAVAEEWSISDITINSDGLLPSSGKPRRGLSIETARLGQVNNLRVEGHDVGIWERSSWSNSFANIRIEQCSTAWRCAAGQNTGGVPSQRRSIEIDSCDTGIEIEDNGLESAIFEGGSIEGCRTWALKIEGGRNRALTFLGINFEANSREGSYPDIIVDKAGSVGEGPSCISFIGCRFMNRSHDVSRRALTLNKGTGLVLSSCQFLGYKVAADLNDHFGSLVLQSIKGVPSFTTGDYEKHLARTQE